MKAYKVFNADWACRGFQFEVGKKYHQDGEIELCSNGFHACKKAVDCFNYYSFDPSNKVAEVELSGVVKGEEQEKSCSSDIELLREVTWEEVLVLVNSGDMNSGNRNSGNMNSGYRNSGDMNSGYRNSGDMNSGNWNSGDRNSGDRNSGYRNSGDMNSGNWNSGNWNSGDMNSGYMNSNEPFVRMFNKDTNLRSDEIVLPNFFYFDLTQWVSHDTATEEEKKEYEDEIETCGGFLKTLDYKEAFKRSYSNTTKEDQEKVKTLPNFDADIFFEISGIRV